MVEYFCAFCSRQAERHEREEVTLFSLQGGIGTDCIGYRRQGWTDGVETWLLSGT